MRNPDDPEGILDFRLAGAEGAVPAGVHPNNHAHILPYTSTCSHSPTPQPRNPNRKS